MSQAPDQTPQLWELVDDRLLNACKVWDLRARHYRHPTNGKVGEFYYLDSRDWAIVVARTTQGELILVRQFRWGMGGLSWEFPGGIVDKGEDPVEAGLRELQEETGYRAKQGELIGSCSPNPAILNNRTHIIFADQVELGPEGVSWDEHEEVEVRVVAESEVIQWAAENKIDHALALVGLLYYRLKVSA